MELCSFAFPWRLFFGFAVGCCRALLRAAVASGWMGWVVAQQQSYPQAVFVRGLS